MLSIFLVIEFSKLYIIVSNILKIKKEKVIRRPIYMSLFFLTLAWDVIFFLRSGLSWNHMNRTYVLIILLIAIVLSFVLIGYIVASLRTILLFVFIQLITLLFDAFFAFSQILRISALTTGLTSTRLKCLTKT